jgi:putative addiction module component (TIGR02574 family)
MVDLLYLICMSSLDEKMLQDLLSLPYNLRADLVDKLIKSLNSPIQKEIDELWSKEAEKRVKEIESGEVEPIDGEKVFQEIRNRI